MFAKLKNKLGLVFSKSWNFLRTYLHITSPSLVGTSPRAKLGLVSFVLLSSIIISVWFIFTPIAHAGIIAGVLETIADIFFALAGFFIKLTFFVLKFIIEVAGYNGFIDSSAVIVGWVMVRDVTNMFFVVVLLIISFGTILGLERYEYKKLLVKLIMAAVIVNFSRIICGLIIDIAQVVMITFVNGIAATASGNLVNMFQVDQIFKLSGSETAKPGTPGEIFLMGVAALVFSVMMLTTMLTFLFLLMARMTMLWVLIVLSPFAFVLNVLPQTEKYASQWWGEFGGHVVAGPIIAFFLWLSFVTVGTGTAHDDIVKNNGLNNQNAIGTGSPEEESTGLGEIMSWEKMANFAIAIAMLLAGAKMAQQLGVVGGSMMGKAGELGKKVAMYASGLQAARWAGRTLPKKAGKLGLKAADFGLSRVGLGSEDWKRRYQDKKNQFWTWRQQKLNRKTSEATQMSKMFRTNKKGQYVKEGGEGITAPKRNADGSVMLDKENKVMYEDQVQSGARDWLTRQATRFLLETGPGYRGFRGEMSEDIAETRKATEEQMAHLASGSQLPVGRAKLAAKQTLKRLEKTGGAIKTGKEVEEEQDMDEILNVIEESEKERIGQDDDTKARLRAELVTKLKDDFGLDEEEVGDVENFLKRKKRSLEGAAQTKVTGELNSAVQSNKEAKALEKYLKVKGSTQEEKTSVVKAETKQIEDKLHAEKELEELQAIRKLLEGEGKAKNEATTAIKAETESLQDVMDLQKNKSTLLARAGQYESEGQFLKGGLTRQRANSLELNKMKEVFKEADIGPNERANIASQIMAQIKKVRGNTALSDKERTKQLSSLIKQKDSLNDLNSTLGVYDAKKEEEEELRTLGWTESLNLENAGRRFLSRKIGRIVNEGEEGGALKEYQEIVGKQEFQNRMRQLGAHAKNQVGMGNTSAAVFKEEPESVDGQLTGLTDYTPIKTTRKGVVATLRGWNAAGDIEVSKMREAVGSRSLSSDGGSVLSTIFDEEADINAELIGSYDTHAISTMGNKRPLLGDLNSSLIDKVSLAFQLEAFAKRAKDKAAFMELCRKKLDKIIAKNKVEEKELEDLFDAVKPASLAQGPVVGEKAAKTTRSKGKGRRR